MLVSFILLLFVIAMAALDCLHYKISNIALLIAAAFGLIVRIWTAVKFNALTGAIMMYAGNFTDEEGSLSVSGPLGLGGGYYTLGPLKFGAVLDVLLGFGLPFILCFILFYFSMMGAGDIKLLMVIGIFTGASLICSIMLIALIIAAIIALIKMYYHHLSVTRGFYFMEFIQNKLTYYSGGKYKLPYSNIVPGGVLDDIPYISKEEIEENKPWLMHLTVPIAAALFLRLYIL